MTTLAAVLLVTGAALELLALLGAYLDLRDAHKEAQNRTASMSTMMAATKYTVNDWITSATRTRQWGLLLFVLGVLIQLVANLLAL